MDEERPRKRPGEVILDCERGRALGCATFCCRLLVRLAPHERTPGAGRVLKSCVDKTPDGLCVHMDRTTHGCSIWETRPEVCRGFDCNESPLLPVVLRDGFHSLVQLVMAPKADAPLREAVPRR